MRKISFAIIFAFFAMALSAQDAIKVNYKGAKPTISDFVWALLSSAVVEDNDEDCVDESANAFKQAWLRHRQGLPQEEGDKLTVDEKNGYVLYESRYDDDLLKMEVCYWNEADGKHKLIAYNVASYRSGKFIGGQYDGILFYRYDNATKKMTLSDDKGLEKAYDMEDGAMLSYGLPRVGKDITVTWTWFDSGKEKKKTIKWNGHRFNF